MAQGVDPKVKPQYSKRKKKNQKNKQKKPKNRSAMRFSNITPRDIPEKCESAYSKGIPHPYLLQHYSQWLSYRTANMPHY
jgi:hypothetical protein